MAVKIIELAGIGATDGSAKDAPIINAATVITSQSVTIGGVASAAFDLRTRYVEIDSDTACRVEFGSAPAGTGHTFYIPATTPRQFGVNAGDKVIAVAA